MSILNLPDSTISQVMQEVVRYCEERIRRNDYNSGVKPLFLWSLPGLGKTMSIRGLKQILEEKLPVQVEIRDFRLTETTQIELIGLMKEKPETDELQFIGLEHFREPENGAVVIYLFDELDKVSGELKKIMMGLVDNHRFLTHRLPEKTIIIAAGNPGIIDGKLYSPFIPELNNRFTHYKIVPDFTAWKVWALHHGVNQYVIDFLSAQNHLLHDMGGEDDGNTAFPSPRSWVAVSDYISSFDQKELDWDGMYLTICGNIGIEAGIAFKTFCTTTCMIPDMEDIFLGKKVEVPQKADSKNAAIKSMITYVLEHEEQMDAAMWENCCRYINSFPEDYAASFYSKMLSYASLLSVNTTKMPMVLSRAFKAWNRKHGYLLVSGV